MSERKVLCIDIDDATKGGVYRDFESTARGSFGMALHNDTLYIKFRPVRRSDIEGKVWEDVNTQSAGHDWRLGEPDKQPISGTWPLTANGLGTGLTALAYNITGPALQAAMNANANVAAVGGVTVSTTTVLPGTFVIEVNNANAALVLASGTNTLWPDTTVSISTPRTAAVGRKQLSVIKLASAPYARCQVFNGVASSAVSIIHRQIGTETKKAIQRLVFSEAIDPYEGNLILNWDKPEIVNLPCKANTAVKEQWTATLLADVAGSLAGLYDDLSDDAGPVRVWLSNGVAVAPPLPAGGRLLAVAYTNGFTSAQMAVAYATALDVDAKFVASVTNTNQVKIVAHAEGVRVAYISRNSGISFLQNAAGTNGVLAGTTVKLFGVNGSVGLYFQVAGGPVPVAATLCDKQIAATVVPNDSAANVATSAKNALDADPDFIAVILAGTNTVKITDFYGGEREDAVDIDSGLSPNVKQQGKSFTANTAYDADEQVIEAEFSNQWEVIRRKNGNIDFRSLTNGPVPLITVDAGDLAFPNILEGVMPLSTYPMLNRWLSATAEEKARGYIVMVLEGAIAFPGESMNTFLRVVFRVYRSVVDDNNLVPQLVPNFIGTNARWLGGELQFLNPTTGLWHPCNPEGAAGAEVWSIGAGVA